jgi:hypothetical protein
METHLRSKPEDDSECTDSKLLHVGSKLTTGGHPSPTKVSQSLATQKVSGPTEVNQEGNLKPLDSEDAAGVCACSEMV